LPSAYWYPKKIINNLNSPLDSSALNECLKPVEQIITQCCDSVGKKIIFVRAYRSEVFPISYIIKKDTRKLLKIELNKIIFMSSFEIDDSVYNPSKLNKYESAKYYINYYPKKNKLLLIVMGNNFKEVIEFAFSAKSFLSNNITHRWYATLISAGHTND
jgi:hypothetical protein